MGLFGKKITDWDASGVGPEDCRRSGGHDQRMHVRDKGTDHECTVVDCIRCGKEWSYDKKGNRR